MDGATAVGSGSGAAFLLAIVNAWLAAHRGRSALGWFLASLILAPISFLLTIFLFTRPHVPGPEDRAVAVAAGILWAIVLLLLLVALFGVVAGVGAGR